MSVKKFSEEVVVKHLQQQIGGEREYRVAHGRIDLLTEKEIIEVKHIYKYKSAVGQILFYSEALPFTRNKRVHLFGHTLGKKYDHILKYMARHDVVVTFDTEFCYKSITKRRSYRMQSEMSPLDVKFVQDTKMSSIHQALQLVGFDNAFDFGKEVSKDRFAEHDNYIGKSLTFALWY